MPHMNDRGRIDEIEKDLVFESCFREWKTPSWICFSVYEIFIEKSRFHRTSGL